MSPGSKRLYLNRHKSVEPYSASTDLQTLEKHIDEFDCTPPPDDIESAKFEGLNQYH